MIPGDEDLQHWLDRLEPFHQWVFGCIATYGGDTRTMTTSHPLVSRTTWWDYTAKRSTAAHAFPAGDQNPELAFTPELKQHLHRNGRGDRQQGKGRIARVQPGERSTGTWIQLFKHQTKLKVAWHPREKRFQEGQGVLDDWRRLCLRAGAQVSCRTPGSDRV